MSQGRQEVAVGNWVASKYWETAKKKKTTNAASQKNEMLKNEIEVLQPSCSFGNLITLRGENLMY